MGVDEFANQSDMVSFAIILICLVLTALFLYFFGMSEFPQRSESIFKHKQRNMVKVQNPFVLSLQEGSGKLQDGLSLSLSALCPSTVVVLWGPKINPFHDFILLPGSKIYSSCLHHRETIRHLEPLHIETLRYKDPGKHKIILPCPTSVTCSSLGNMPRQRYPVAILVFISRNDGQEETNKTNPSCNTENYDDGIRNTSNVNHRESDRESELDPDGSEELNSIIGVISIIHMKDEIVTQDSHVIVQYVKTAGVAIYSLRPLFMSKSDDTSTKPHPETAANESTTDHQNSSDNVEMHHYVNTHSSAQANSRMGNFHSSSQEMDRHNSVEEPLAEHKPSSNDIVASCHSTPPSVSLTKANTNNCVSDPPPLNQTNSSGRSIRKRLSTKATQDNYNEEKDGTEHASFVLSDDGRVESPDDGCDQRTSPLSSPIRNVQDGEVKKADVSECVVCQSKSVECVILPCRHTCSCLKCLKLLDRCPLCRGSIDSYFMLTKDEDDEDSESQEDELMEGMQRQAIAGNTALMLERLNEVLGFR